MQPHTLSCSCAGHPVIKLTAAWDSELKKKLAARDYHTHWLQMYQALIMQSSLCCRESLVCVVGSVRSPLGEWTLYVLCRHQTCQKCMIPWIQLNKSDLAYDSPHSHSPHQPPPPTSSCIDETCCRIWKRYWRPHREDRSLLLCPSKRVPCSASALLTGSPIADLLFIHAEHFCHYFTSLQGGKSQGRARPMLPGNPDLPLLINVYSQHMGNHLEYLRTTHYAVGGPQYCHKGEKS